MMTDATAGPANSLAELPVPKPLTSRILIIDDTLGIHEDFRKILAQRENAALDRAESLLFDRTPAAQEATRFLLDSAYQGQEGLALVQRATAEGRPYTLAFVDVRMPPGWDGIETAARLWEVHPDLQIVICTAHADHSWDEVTQLLGPRDNLLILKKPFDAIEVRQLAHALTRKWGLTQESKRRLQDLDRLVSQRTQELCTANERLRQDILERQRADEALRVSEERFRSVWERSVDGMRLTDQDGRIVGVNEAFCKLVRLPRENLEGHVFSVTYQGHGPNDGIEVYRQRFATGAILPRLTARVVLWNAEEFDIEITSSLIELGPHGKLLLSIFRDISDRTGLEEQLRQAQKMEAIGQLAGGVAHDFNNLLTIIRGYSELLLMDPERLDRAAKESLQHVVAAADRAANLTRQLLAFSRKQIMQSQPLDLNGVIANLTRMLNRIIGEDIRLQCEYGSCLPLVQGDAGMMEQVLLNLVVNARDAMPKGGQLRITTRRKILEAPRTPARPEAHSGAFVCLTVGDTGTGIAQEHLAHVFEPFFTTKDVGKGTGLGLATVYGIIKQHQGWVEVASEVGVGTTFSIFLPAMDASATVLAAKPAAVDLPRGGTERILLVEDDHAVRSLTRTILERSGYRVQEATSGREALSLWRANATEIDLLLTDIIMPDGVTGGQLAEGLRAARPDLKVIFMSGYSGDALGDETARLEKSRGRFLQKPCGGTELIRAIRECLDAPAGG